MSNEQPDPHDTDPPVHIDGGNDIDINPTENVTVEDDGEDADGENE